MGLEYRNNRLHLDRAALRALPHSDVYSRDDSRRRDNRHSIAVLLHLEVSIGR